MRQPSFNREVYPEEITLRSVTSPHRFDRRGSTAELARGLYKWNPGLNTRADLTLKRWIQFFDTEDGERGARRVVPLRQDEDVIATVVRMMNRLNRYVYHSDRKAKRLNAIVFWELSAEGSPHVHALIERPDHVSEKEFATLVSRAWSAQPFANKQRKIEPVKDLEASLAYNAKMGQDRLIYFHKQEVTL